MPSLHKHISFSDEQAMLLEAAAAFCREQSPSATVRRLLADERGYDPAVWQRIVEMGWTGLAVPEDFGGSGLGVGHLAVIAEPMGRHLLATPFASSQLAVQALLAAPAAAQQAWCPKLAQGAPATVALFEDDGGWAIERPLAQARRAGDRVSLHGLKTLVTDAAVAELLVVSVQLDGALALVLLPSHALPPGALAREQVIDETRRCHRLKLDGVVLPASAVVTGPAAHAALQRIRRAALLLAAAEAAGGIAGALDVVVDYLNTREAFGRKIGSYQGLKHPAADMLVTLERSRSHVAHAATLLNPVQVATLTSQADPAVDPADVDLALAMAKAEAGDGLLFAGDRAVQFHGGFGFTWDCDAQLYLRRAVWLQAWFGDAAHHRKRIADALWPLAA